jgi:hypothetical protein
MPRNSRRAVTAVLVTTLVLAVPAGLASAAPSA